MFFVCDTYSILTGTETESLGQEGGATVFEKGVYFNNEKRF
jgi:hypothetical protein